MRKLFNICVLSLLASIAAAQSTATHQLKVTWQPLGSIFMQAYYTDSNGKYQQYNSEALDAFDMQVSAGQNVSFSGHGQGFVLKQVTANGQAIDFETSESSYDTYYGTYYFTYTMPDADVELVFSFEYDPDAPDFQPGDSGWYPETGTLVLDHRTYSYPSNFNMEEDADKVLRLILGGPWGYSCSSSDARLFPHCHLLDYSRTATTQCSSWQDWSETAVTEVILPSTMQELREGSFAGAHLQSLTCFAMTPPKMSGTTGYDDNWNIVYKQQNAFTDCPGMVVYVPEDALPLYQNANGWKEFTILPIEGNSVSLNVNLMAAPTDAALALYKNMHLELTSLGTGQVRRLLVGPRNAYTFRYLPTNTSYRLVLRSASGAEMGRIDAVTLGETDGSVTFTQLKAPRTVTLSVIADGEQVDNTLYTASWLNADGLFIKQANQLEGMLEGQQLHLFVALDRELAMKYEQPDTIAYTVGANNGIELTLNALPTTTVHFTILDQRTGQGINKASIRVAQLLWNGATGHTLTLTTDADGKTMGQVVRSMSSIVATSSIHGTQSMIANLNDSTDFTLLFTIAEGTEIQMNYTYQPTVDEGKTPTVQQGYSDVENLNLSFIVEDTGEVLTDYRNKNPHFTLFKQLPPGTRLRAIANSTNGSVGNSIGMGTVDEEGHCEIAMPLQQSGGFKFEYALSETIRPALLLFNNSNGQLVSKRVFPSRENWMTFSELPSAEYLVVAMSQGEQFDELRSKSQLHNLIEGKDYLSASVLVQEGVMKHVSVSMIPRTMSALTTNLKDSRANFKQPIVNVGEYATISVTASFSDELAIKPTNVRLVVNLPEDVKFVHNSVLKEKEAAPYNYEGSQLTMPWDELADAAGNILFCVMPIKAGTLQPEAYIAYTLNGEEHLDPLLATTLTVLAQSISVPELVLTPSFTIKGTAPKNFFPDPPQQEMHGASHNARAGGPNKAAYNWHDPNFDYFPITIMDGNEEIGKISPYGGFGGVYTSYCWMQGEWKGTCTLPNPYVRSKHKIWAKMKGRNGTLETAAHEVTYDPDGVIPLTVDMSFFNYHPVHLENQEVHFDMVNGNASPNSYGFSNEEGYNTDFTFEINLSNNDTAKVYAVALYIYTDGPDAEERATLAHYNKRKDRWVAYEKFNTRSLPYDVYVRPYYHKNNIGDRREFDEPLDYFNEVFKAVDDGYPELKLRLDQLMAQGQAAHDAGNDSAIPYADIKAVVKQIFALKGLPDIDDPSIPSISQEQLDQKISQLVGLDAEGGSFYDTLGRELNQLDDIVKGFNGSTAEGLNEATLLAEGYQKTPLNDGSAIYILANDDGSWTYVDLARNIKFSMTPEAADASRMLAPLRNEGEGWDISVEMMINYANTFLEYAGYMGTIASGIITSFPSMLAQSEEVAFEIGKELANSDVGWFRSSWLNLKLEAVLSYNTALTKIKDLATKFKIGDGVGTLASIYSCVNDIKTTAQFFVNLNRLIKQVPDPCPKDQANAEQLLSEMRFFRATAIPAYLTQLAADGVALWTAYLSWQTAGKAPELGFGGLTASLTQLGLSLWAKYELEKKTKANMEGFVAEVARLQCSSCPDPDDPDCKECDDPPCCEEPPCAPHAPKFPPVPGPPTGSTSGSIPIQDPSGFVYEGVESNRVQGATTTVFYKNQTTNMYGDPVDVVTVWDAENYGQQNPQLTDENGEYGWMVPEGWWQVKYEKEGYQTELSEWLPVPPPQLDVNQQLVQYSQPIVSGVKATQQGVQVQFDKYMRPATLTTENIHVTRQGNELPGTIELLNAEQHDGVELASKVRFVPSESLPVGQTLVLTVGGDVQSYAKVAMGDAFTQEFDIVQAVEKIVADSAVNVIYDQTTELTISALPAQAAAGHKVKVRQLSDVVASISTDELTLDAGGKAALRITGEAHGTTGIILKMDDDEDVQTLVMVNVKDESDFVCPLPTANYISGTQLYYGTAVELSSELPGATIYYTLDGSCPCEQDMKYTQPIIVTADTYIKAIAVADGYTDSDIRELRYTVRRDATRLHLPVGWTWLSHAQRDEVALSQLGEGIDYVVGEAGNQVSMLLPATAYKAHTNTSHDALLQGFAWDAATGIIQLQKGWNWMPYPMPVALTPAEALAYALPQDGEVLVGEDGFAIYESGWDGAAWTGTLQKLEPGRAYMYLSTAERPIFLNTTVVKSQADNVQPPTMFRWYDRHAQPNRMPVVAQLYDAQGTLIDSDLARYEVMAWSSDDQCRGNGYWMERQGCLFLNVVGLDGEQVEFRVHDTLTDKTHALRVVDHSALTFTTDVQGTLAQPIRLEMGGELSGIIDVQRSVSCVTSIYDLQGRRVTTPQQPNSGMQRGVYIDRGKKIVVK